MKKITFLINTEKDDLGEILYLYTSAPHPQYKYPHYKFPEDGYVEVWMDYPALDDDDFHSYMIEDKILSVCQDMIYKHFQNIIDILDADMHVEWRLVKHFEDDIELPTLMLVKGRRD